MSFQPPTIAQFKAQFPRDFKYGSGFDTVQDVDIQAALNIGQGLFNPSLFSTNIPSFSTLITGDTTSGSATIINLSSVTGLQPGQNISGVGIPASTTILLVGLTSIVISANATATATGVQLTIGGVSGFSVSEAQIAYSYLTAHFLVLSLQNSGGLGAVLSYQGPASSGGGIVQTKSIDGVSIGYAFPDYVINSPTLSQYLRTGYGQIYLQMATPKLPGRRVMVVGGEPTIDSADAINNLTSFIPTEVL